MEALCLANVMDLPKMLRWNDKYGIKFMRLSSEMFPFASHLEYGYKLAPFASDALAEVGRVVTELGHRVSTHPGQFTQLGSPRAEVISSAIRDLEYHDEMLSLLNLQGQDDRDAVMILHMGGTFGDKAATIDRFRENYKHLSPAVKQRFILENDDVSWSVHDLLPICEELNIPLCLDFHHHNIIFDSKQVREGTLDIVSLFPRIKATWDRKGIRQKMHYSEGCPDAITGRQRRKHNPRPVTLPPCPNEMDLMIEAKDKEQAVFELMRNFKLPGWDTFNNIIPYERADDNKPFPKKGKKKKTKKQIATEIGEFGKELTEEEESIKEKIPENEIGMGGKENRVYWPVGMEEWLRPKKREVKKKAAEDEVDMFRNPTPANFEARKAIIARNKLTLDEDFKEKLTDAKCVADVEKVLEEIKFRMQVTEEGPIQEANARAAKKPKTTSGKGAMVPSKPTSLKMKKGASIPPTQRPSKMEEEDDEEVLSTPDLSADEEQALVSSVKSGQTGRQSSRMKGKRMSYAEAGEASDVD